MKAKNQIYLFIFFFKIADCVSLMATGSHFARLARPALYEYLRLRTSKKASKEIFKGTSISGC